MQAGTFNSLAVATVVRAGQKIYGFFYFFVNFSLDKNIGNVLYVYITGGVLKEEVQSNFHKSKVCIVA
ncbi:MAG: hypothetical protein AMJ43_07465 [Coxiella sp. DG_40]|nr:MAG: hypothetical protein AMJ43_07465 [Coxiella sp. DG_40]